MADRLAQLQKLLEAEPNDPFLLYGAALEHKKVGDADKAIEYLDRTLVADAGYCYAYYQKAQILEESGDEEAAIGVYKEGIAAAERAGDAHAKDELAAALMILE